MRGLTGESIRSLGSPLARVVEVHEALASTQDRARELARAGAPHGTLVVAGVQTGGRGRLRRAWGSPEGGLWMSLVLRPDLEAAAAPRVTQTAAVAVAKALRELGANVGIKWPNDLLVEPGGRKICGILAESGIRGAAPPEASCVDHAILGVGLNANLDPEDLGVPDSEVATLRHGLGRDVESLDLLRHLLRNLEDELDRIHDFAAILDDWRVLNVTLGERVRVRRSGETLEGRAVDLGPGGELHLQTADGLVELYEGEVEQLRRDIGDRAV
ncbi:MAG: Biotin--protein ligase (EC / Biotin operon repressor [uncultured Rubrobacteraceae bacterium]|uniref:biotin--[biotin carboxyl-carrier protein] ligase n=1 Tax=uncultured Rubrobacteraceae bacterium TaxID=349277 RepID=A0A6J4P241_9ACTN|nr:MAG: Biotin--protein ligase (EC / Biotin operon repressor [uncultured Rubrobacteraceae bacterium]